MGGGSMSQQIPHSTESERAILGGLMLEPSLMPRLASTVEPAHFYRESHGRLFALMAEMDAAGAPCEMVAVVEEVGRRGLVDLVGGVAYVSALPDNVPSTENLDYYAALVRERYTERKLLEASREVAAEVLSGEHTVAELVERSAARMAGLLASTVATAHSTSVADLVGVALDDLVMREENRKAGRSVGLPLPWPSLAAKLSIQPGTFNVWMAPPGAGKTSAALQVALHNGLQGIPCGVCSLEMSRTQVVQRWLFQRAQVDTGRGLDGYLSAKQGEWQRIRNAAEELHGLPLEVDDRGGLTVEQVRGQVARWKSKHPALDLVVVDYLQIMGWGQFKDENSALTHITTQFVEVAKEFDVRIIGISQLNRAAANRGDKRPQLSDARGSGGIEQAAASIVGWFRDEYFTKDMTTRPGEADAIILKNRFGPTGEVALRFVANETRFEELNAPQQRPHHDHDDTW